MKFQNSFAIKMVITLGLIVGLAWLTPAMAQQTDEELRAASQNPVASVISVPFQNSTHFGVGPDDKVLNVLNIQPVIPFSLHDRLNIITRTIVPIIYVPGSVGGLGVLPEGVGDGTSFGLGDINFSAFFTPAHPRRIIWGVGPSITLPTASDDLLGSEKISVGPTAVVLTQAAPWSIGVLLRQLWSVAGDDDRADVNQFLVQPFVTYNLEDGWSLSTGPGITANWDAASGQRWTIPVGGGIGRLFRVGRRPVSASLSSYYNVERPDNAPEWRLQIQVSLLFPR